MTNPTRQAFLKACLELVHVPYIYGSRSPDGVDCWGFIALAWFRAGGDDTYYHWWTDAGWNRLSKLPKEEEGPSPGDLAFYGGNAADDVSHVMVCLWNRMMIGASGGSSHTRTPLDAAEKNAKVKIIQDSSVYNRARGDFRGYRVLPFEGE